MPPQFKRQLRPKLIFWTSNKALRQLDFSGTIITAFMVLHLHNFLTATEQDGADLLKRVLEKVGTYTDVLASIGSFAFTTPILEQSLDVLRKVSS